LSFSWLKLPSARQIEQGVGLFRSLPLIFAIDRLGQCRANRGRFRAETVH
jgi:hypothetical protein